MALNLLIVNLLNILIIWLLKKKIEIINIYRITLICNIINLIITLIMIHLYNPNNINYQFQFNILGYQGGIDGISLYLILLINIIIPIVILNSWKNNLENNYIILILWISFWSINVFLLLDLLLFYISFESVLIPMYLLISYYGSRNRKIEAKYLLILYTLLGSLFLLIGILILYIELGTTDYISCCILPINNNKQIILFICFFIAFAIKIPLIPFHIWLPIVHTEAPTGGSIILAAILLKFGTYGLIRFNLILFPYASFYFTPFISILALIGLLYSCISALSLIDIKQIIAYSSIAHLNLSVLGIFSNDINGLLGSYFASISHGFISGGLFLLIGFLYDRYHTRILKYYRGLTFIMPLFISFLFFFIFSNMGLPGTSGFIGEILIYFSLFHISPFILFFSSFILILLPIYTLWTFQKISYGHFSNYLSLIFQDLNIKEFHLILPLFFFSLYFGLFPNLILNSIFFSLFNCLY